MSVALEIFTEGLFDDNSVDAVLGVAVFFDALGHINVDGRWQSHVEDAVALSSRGAVSGLFEGFQVLVKLLEGFSLIVSARDVGVELQEFVELALLGVLDVLRDAFLVLLLNQY